MFCTIFIKQKVNQTMLILITRMKIKTYDNPSTINLMCQEQHRIVLTHIFVNQKNILVLLICFGL